MGVEADAVACRSLPFGDQAGAGAKAVLRRLGGDAAFDGMAGKGYIGLLKRQRLAAGDAQLLRDQIDAGDHFSDRVFDLDARVHLEKIIIFVSLS